MPAPEQHSLSKKRRASTCKCLIAAAVCWPAPAAAAAREGFLDCAAEPDHAHIASLVERTGENQYQALKRALGEYYEGLVMPRVEAGCEYISMTSPQFEMPAPQPPPAQAADDSPAVRCYAQHDVCETAMLSENSAGGYATALRIVRRWYA